MERDVFEQIISDYHVEENKLRKLEEKKKRLSDLEKNLIVKEYIKLLGEIDASTPSKISRKELQYRTFLNYRYKIKCSNKIYIYLGTYIDSSETDIIHGQCFYSVSRDNKKAEYSIYKDLETEESVQVSINDRDLFEINNKIIYVGELNGKEEFYNIQRSFISDCFKYGQDIAVQKILQKSVKGSH